MMRELLDITQTDLASRMTITRPSLANIEAGRQRILVHQIQTIARALGTTPKSLMKGIWW
jgi:transcriptional regulator with XRE-family HTH domain